MQVIFHTFLSYGVPCYTETLKVTDDADYMRVAIEKAATPNGAFGAKVIWTYLDSLDINVPSGFAATIAVPSKTGVRVLGGPD